MKARTNLETRPGRSPEQSFISGSIPKAMLTFAWPLMLGMMLQNLYGTVDLFVVGHYATTADISAVTIGSQMMSTITNLIIGVATGVTILIGQAFGAGSEKKLSAVTGSSIAMFSVIAAVVTGIMLAAHSPLVTAMQTPAEAVSATKAYLLVCVAGIPFIVGYNVVTSILTGLGDGKTPFLFIAVACVVNIVLDIVLVRYVHLGALGAAAATTAAQLVSFVFSIFFLRRKGLGFALSKSDIRFDRKEIAHITRIGTPVAVQNVMVSVSFLFVTAIINRMGLIASAAVGVVEKLMVFLFVPAIALSTSVGTGAAQNLGAQKPERAIKCMWWGIAMALVPSVLIAVFCQFGGELLTGILSSDQDVVAMATDYLRSYVTDVVMVSFIFCMNGYFNSCGKSWFSLVHSLVTTFAVRVPGAFLLSRIPDAGLFMIGWAAPASTFVSLLMCLPFLAYIKKKSGIGQKSEI